MQRLTHGGKEPFQNQEWTTRLLRQASGRPAARAAAAPEAAPVPGVVDTPLDIRRHGRELAISAMAVVVAVLVLFAALSTAGAENNTIRNEEINAAVQNALASVTPPPPSAVAAYAAVRPALVEILAHGTDDAGVTSVSYGTGVVINQNGLILTSLHIVRDAFQIDVTFADGTQSGAELDQVEETNDIALLKPQDLPPQIVPAVIGNPHKLQVGDEAIVVGNPMQLTGSLSQGVISGLERIFQPPDGAAPIPHMIQIDAAVNPGNSGGPLLNRDGEVVGIVTGRANPSGREAFIGIGFAVPIDQILGTDSPLPY